MRNIVILTGAGISAESGLATFRAGDGLWCDHRVEDVATPEAFARDPALVQRFYNERRRQLKEVRPNAAHIALAELAERWPGEMMLVTQNVDDLHDRALAERKLAEHFRFIHMHGELMQARCVETGQAQPWEEDITPAAACACCRQPGALRPHIVWFGEMPLQMEEIYQALAVCDLFLSIGTSGNVYPAAGFVQAARMNGKAHTVELNLEPSLGASWFHERRQGRAGTLVPQFVGEILKDI